MQSKNLTGVYLFKVSSKEVYVLIFAPFVLMVLRFSGHRLCNEPSPVDNGYIIGNDFWEGKNITYKCNKGYWLRGPQVRVCDGATGNWTMKAPVCEGIFYSGLFAG